MGVTRFPNGVEVGDGTTAGTFSIGGTAVTATATEINEAAGAAAGNFVSYGSSGKKLFAGTVVVPAGAGGTAFKPSGATSIDFVSASVYGPISGTAFDSVTASKAAGGTITILGYQPDSGGTVTVSSASGTATYLAIGT